MPCHKNAANSLHSSRESATMSGGGIHRWTLLTALLCCFFVIGCNSSSNSDVGKGTPSDIIQSGEMKDLSSTGSFPKRLGKYEVINIFTDGTDNSLAKTNVESVLVKHPDVGCLVGLWSANTPMILQALGDKKGLGTVGVVGFDDHPDTLQGIKDGHVRATIVQAQYEFGFRAGEFLNALATGGSVDVPDSEMLFIPHTAITSENIAEFESELQKMRAGEGPILDPIATMGTETPDGDLRFAFITNGPDPFWELAADGCKRAAGHYGISVEVQKPSNSSIEEQKRFLESNVTQSFAGVAISPIDPANQSDMINTAAAKMPVVCVDSDAPGSDRRFYYGTSNYMAGREAGRLVKELLPDGGSVALFVGRMEVLNAQERSQGIIDELADIAIPVELQ
ncbi:MAG: substrate-binding domain-containing protein [Planctomycetota bacterium]